MAPLGGGGLGPDHRVSPGHQRFVTAQKGGERGRKVSCESE